MSPRFEMIVPPGWVEFDLTTEVEPEVLRVASLLARRAPLSRQPAVRAMVEQELREQVARFADHRVARLRLPLLRVGQPLSPAITLTLVGADDPGSVGDQASGDPVLVLQAIAADDPTADLVTWGACLAVRTHAQAPLDEAALDREYARLTAQVAPEPTPSERAAADRFTVAVEQTYPADQLTLVARRVQYVVIDPERHDRVLLVSFQVDHPAIPEAVELADHEVALFDLMLRTFRWLDD